RLDIFHDGAFGSICDDSATQGSAEVACRQLCFASEGASVQSGGQGGGASGATPGTGAIWLDEVRCAGTEAAIQDCPHNGWGNHNCIHAEDLGVCC
ncbi:SRCR-like domain-containing protein, partial [Baffinella frigidus]